MKTQYRISTEGNWTSNYGYAFLAITNVSGSGRKLTLRSMEVQVSSVNNGSSATGSMPCTLVRCATPLLGGEDMRFASVLADSATALPTTTVVRRKTIATAYADKLRHVDMVRRSAGAGTQNIGLTGCPMQFGLWRGGSGYRSATKAMAGALEPITVRNGEALVLVCDQQANPYSCPVRLNVCVSVNGKTVNWDFVSLLTPGHGVFSLENTGAGDVVKLLGFSWAELGTNDTPTIRMVPIGQIYARDAPDSSKQGVSVTPMDSNYGPLSTSVCKLFTDIGFIPYGVPEVAISPGSAGAPQGMNYLHTRDFNGPMYRNFLPEMVHMKQVGVGASDMLGLSYGHHRRLSGSDLLVRRAGIVINPGEGIALVSSAETAVGVQAAYSGWPGLTFAAMIDNEPQTAPSLALTGLVSGSDVVVLTAGTSTELSSVDAGGTTFSWAYDPDVVTAVDIVVYRSGYVPFSIRNLSLGLNGQSVPVSQVIDRNYS